MLRFMSAYWRTNPLATSLLPRCQGLCGSEKLAVAAFCQQVLTDYYAIYPERYVKPPHGGASGRLVRINRDLALDAQQRLDTLI